MGIRATAIALLYYQQEFDSEMIEDLVEFEESFKSGDFDCSTILGACYAMNKADEYGKSFLDFESWLNQFDSEDFADSDFIIEILEEINDGFFVQSDDAETDEERQTDEQTDRLDLMLISNAKRIGLSFEEINELRVVDLMSMIDVRVGDTENDVVANATQKDIDMLLS